MAHTCHAIGCIKNVPPEMFMCKTHWFALPKSMRDRVWASYRPGQCDDWQPSSSYCDIAQRCVEFIARKEGIKITGNEPELKLYSLFKQ